MEVRPTKRDTEYFVASETGEGEYQLVNVNGIWKCTCKAYLKSKLPCKHVDHLLAYLKEREGGVEPEEEGMSVPPSSTQHGLSKWVVTIHGKETIRYQGLLAMAHEQGLASLGARFTSLTADLAVAVAEVVFTDGRKFWEAGESTPTNVQAGVRASWARMALTRAKALVLRDALNIGMVSTEELED